MAGYAGVPLTRKLGVRPGAVVALVDAPDGVEWIIWPKKASGVDTDLTQAVVRQRGLAAGLVDYKIAAIDATWSGLRFTVRRSG